MRYSKIGLYQLVIYTLLFSFSFSAFAVTKVDVVEQTPKASGDDDTILEQIFMYLALGKKVNNSKAKNKSIYPELTKGQQGKIASSIRRCHRQDTAAKDYANNVAYLVVTVDETGEARIVKFDDATNAKASRDIAYRAFIASVRDAILNPICSKLPIPSSMLGKRNTIRFVFRL